MNSFNDDSLIDYVLGLATESERQLIEEGMEQSASLRDRVASLRDTVAMPGLAVVPMQPDSDLQNQIFNSIGPVPTYSGFVGRLSVFLDLPEKRVSEILAYLESPEKYLEQSGLPGIRKLEVEAGLRHADSDCALFLMERESVFPQHSHLGEEWGFILQGEAREDSGRRYQPGDIVYKTKEQKHSFTSIGKLPFVFFVVHNGISFDSC